MSLILSDIASYFNENYKAVLFDFDGVVLESVDARDDAFYDLFDECPDDVRRQVLQYHREHPGMDRAIKIKNCFEGILGISPDEKDLQARLARFGDLAINKSIQCGTVAGVEDLLVLLQSESCFVVSAARQDEVRYIAQKKRLSHYFHEIYGGPTTKVVLINSLLLNLNVNVREIVFIGDKISDWMVAEECGVNFIGRNIGNVATFPADIRTIHDFRLDSMVSLVKGCP